MKKIINLFFITSAIFISFVSSTSASENTNIAVKTGAINEELSDYHLLNSPLPYYPRKARFNEVEGFVKINITFNKKGEVIDIDILQEKNIKSFEEAVLYTVSTWQIKPQKVSPTIITRTFNFNMSSNASSSESSVDNISGQTSDTTYQSEIELKKYYKEQYKAYIKRKHGSGAI